MMDRQSQFLGMETTRARSVSGTLARLWQYFRRYGLILLGVGVLVVSSTYMQVLVPDLTGQAVDCYLGPYSTAAAAGGGAALGAFVDDVEQAGAFSNCWYTTPDLTADRKSVV